MNSLFLENLEECAISAVVYHGRVGLIHASLKQYERKICMTAMFSLDLLQIDKNLRQVERGFFRWRSDIEISLANIPVNVL